MGKKLIEIYLEENNKRSSMKITVTLKNIYGHEVIYPACPQSALLAELAGTRTLTKQAIAVLKKLGYEIEVINPITTL